MHSASDLAGRLARDAEAVCRHYLSAGRRAGNYWLVGDVSNRKGRSLYVHLVGPRAGRWTDAATGQFGDLLDLIRETCGLVDFRDQFQIWQSLCTDCICSRLDLSSTNSHKV